MTRKSRTLKGSQHYLAYSILSICPVTPPCPPLPESFWVKAWKWGIIILKYFGGPTGSVVGLWTPSYDWAWGHGCIYFRLACIDCTTTCTTILVLYYTTILHVLARFRFESGLILSLAFRLALAQSWRSLLALLNTLVTFNTCLY